MQIKYAWIDAQTAGLAELITELDAFQNAIYPPEVNNLDSLATLAKSQVSLIGAYRGAELVGCCALKSMPGYGELKRLFVKRDCRGQGVAREMIQRLEQRARALGMPLIRLETGIYQNPALKLYQQMGYRAIAPFGDYSENGYSVYFGKRLKG